MLTRTLVGMSARNAVDLRWRRSAHHVSDKTSSSALARGDTDRFCVSAAPRPMAKRARPSTVMAFADGRLNALELATFRP